MKLEVFGKNSVMGNSHVYVAAADGTQTWQKSSQPVALLNTCSWSIALEPTWQRNWEKEYFIMTLTLATYSKVSIIIYY